jgi:hypothetical protein
MLRAVTDRDPFGRDREEDPLAAMGWTGEATSAGATPRETDTASLGEVAPPEPSAPRLGHLPTATTAGAGAPPHATPTQMPATAARRPAHHRPATTRAYGRPSGGRRAARGLVVLAVLAAGIGAVALYAVPGIRDAVDEISRQIDEAGDLAAPGGDAAGGGSSEARPPTGLGRRSLLLRGNLAPALRRMRARAGGRLLMLRVAPDRIDAQVVTQDGRLRSAQARHDGQVAIISDVEAQGARGAGTYSWSQVNASAPRRIVRAMQRGRPTREVGYLVLMNAGGLRWSAFRQDGTGFTARADGRGVTRIAG